ncbi:hypothetical protein Hypma_016158 [Hypsizygus marmoreus]|uniref:Uncharacterized protein n=1 Tax=Hypsizygus marmoreus TaxID=39966 RepID=A0A369J3J2_HYPMA|nr:hypothetical protein Hypma_016158 [Hypsizygus marmoreus]
MKFFLQQSVLVACSLTVMSAIAMPIITGDDAVALRAPSTDTFFESRSYYEPVDLEVRGPPGAPSPGGEVVHAVGGLLVDVVKGIQAGIEADKENDIQNRSKFTQDLVNALNSKSPKLNYVICHTKHSTAFEGTKGTDWGHAHQEFDIKVGGTIGYEIYWFTAGKFTRQGDGGYLNWAYVGNVKSKSPDGKEIVFGRR